MATRIDMIGIFVSDLTRMVAFYRDVLGFHTDWNGEGPYAEFTNDGVRFSMYMRSELPALLGSELSFPVGINGTFELAVDLPHFGDVDGEFRRLVAAGARPLYEPRDEPWGMRSSMITDPEGNLIEIGSWDRG
jgi:lactoylglutathione lyase